MKLSVDSRNKLELLTVRWMEGEVLTEAELNRLVMIFVVESRDRPGTIASGARERRGVPAND